MTAVEEFFSWWFARLGELIPDRFGTLLDSRKAKIAIHIDGQQATVSSGDIARTLALPADNNPLDGDAAAQLRSELPSSPEQIELTLSATDYLRNQLTLPRAARNHLAEAVSYQLPQLTPFSADQLLYACGENGESVDDDRKDSNIGVWLVAIPRQKLARVLDAIGQSTPGNPLTLRQAPQAGAPLKLAWRASDSGGAGNGPRLAWWGLIVLLIALGGLHLYNQHRTQTLYAEQLDTLRLEAADVLRLRERVDGVRDRSEWLSAKTQSVVTPLALLDSLSRNIEDQTWLQRFDLRKDRLTLVGFSPAPAALIEKLENTEVLEDVRFDAAITRDNRGKGDRFNVSARVSKRAPGGRS